MSDQTAESLPAEMKKTSWGVIAFFGVVFSVVLYVVWDSSRKLSASAKSLGECTVVEMTEGPITLILLKNCSKGGNYIYGKR